MYRKRLSSYNFTMQGRKKWILDRRSQQQQQPDGWDEQRLLKFTLAVEPKIVLSNH